MIINTTALIYILIATIIILAALVIRLELKLKKLLAGKSGRSLEKVITDTAAATRHLDTLHKEMRQHIEEIRKALRKRIKKAEVVRFDAGVSGGSGGNQSFATALIDEDGDGVILTSLYMRDRISVFAKPIKGHQSDYKLSDEEKTALERARLN